jgi:lipid-binding SYLF domain-containing protein
MLKRVHVGTRLLVITLAIAALAVGAMPARADDAADAKELVEKAQATLAKFAADPLMGGFRAAVKNSKGVLIAPQISRAAVIVGVSGGSGVLLARDQAGKWAGPAFYTMGEASFGLQAGADAAQVALVAMTDRGVQKLLGSNVKLGADVSAAAGPVGAGAEAATAGLSVDILAFSLSQGLYAGISAEGGMIGKRDSLNKAYYGQEVSPEDILVKHTVSNPHAAPLLEEITKVAGGK